MSQVLNLRPAKTHARTIDAIRDMVFVLTVLVMLGFPGKYEEILGISIMSKLEYVLFGAQIFSIVTRHGLGDVGSYELFHLDKKFNGIYLFIAYNFIVSMIVTSDLSEQFISCLRMSVMVLYAIWAVQNYKVEDIVRLTVLTQMILLTFFLLFLTLYPGSSFSHESSGNDMTSFFATKNSCAEELAFGLMVQLMHMKLNHIHGKRIAAVNVVFLGINAVLLPLCHATGAMFNAIAVSIYLLTYKPSQKKLPIGWIYVLASTLFPLLASTIMPKLAPFLQSIGKDATLTGRTLMWAQAWKVITSTKPLFGYGYAMFWRNGDAVRLINSGFSRWSFMGNMDSGAHNAYVDLLLNIGFVGIAAFSWMIIWAFRKVKELPDEVYLFCAGLVFSIMFHGFSERTFFISEYNTFFMYVALAAACHGRKPVAEPDFWWKVT